MLIHPQFDPVAIHLGPLAVHWYGLMYLLGFALFLTMGKYRLKNGNDVLTVPQLDDMLMYGAVGVVVGGRLGEVLFYQPATISAIRWKSSWCGKAACPSTAASSAC